MASFLNRTRGMVQIPRLIPTMMSRGQASQNKTPKDSSVLPKSATSTDHTNPMKTSSDAPPLDHENVDIKNKSEQKQNPTTTSSSSKSSSSGSSQQQQQQPSFLNSSAGKFGTLAVLTIAIYAGYKMIGRGGAGGNDLKKNEHYKRATADYQAANAQGTDVKK